MAFEKHRLLTSTPEPPDQIIWEWIPKLTFQQGDYHAQS